MRQATQHETWTSRFSFILAAIGAAVGLGNIWKFPYLTGTNGGGAFVIVYLISVGAIAIPILMAELMLGRRGRQSPPASMRSNAESEGRSLAWAGVGWIGMIVGFLILTFYSVIGGWVLDYLAAAIVGGFDGMNNGEAVSRFDKLLASPLRLTFWHLIFMGMTAGIISMGLHKGIERVAEILMPALFFMLLILTGYSAVTGDLSAALHFLFDVDFTKINAKVTLTAIGQAFFSIGVSMGLMMTYGAYLTREVRIPRTAVIIALADTGVAILAGLAIFPIVFANGLEPGEGPGLIFVTLPLAFSQMPAGGFFGAVFFLLLLFAALTSSIAILEPAVSWAEEHRNINRKTGTLLVGVAAWGLGLVSVFSFNLWADVAPLGFIPGFAEKTFFDLVDYLTANLLMPIGGMLIAIFAGWLMARASTREELALTDGIAYKCWLFLIRTLVPVAIAAILVTNLI